MELPQTVLPRNDLYFLWAFGFGSCFFLIEPEKRKKPDQQEKELEVHLHQTNITRCQKSSKSPVGGSFELFLALNDLVT